ncbi:MAG TPA: PilN domain-containing protein [Bryobacteraceae bacterium]|nr:PilN domain-containing protein [Bryobacteraceae bacterium]
MTPASIRKWVAFGGGLGIQISGPRGAESLHVAAVRVRPSGARVLGQFTIEDFPHQAAGVWGTDYAAFARKLGLAHVGATVILPRQDVIVRTLALPGVGDSDLAAAVQFQLEGLHPYSEDDVVTSWAKLEGSAAVLVAIARREVVDRYALAFAEAGVKVASFTCSAAAIHSALRLFGTAPASNVLAWEHTGEQASGQTEIYGESAARPVFSATFDTEPERAAALAVSELRVTEPTLMRFEELLGAAPGLPYAASLVSACPRAALPLNLLPEEQRHTSSRALWIPSAALGAIVLLLAGAMAAFPRFEDRRYLRSLDAEIAKVQPGAKRAAALDREIELTRQRTLLLDEIRKRPKTDMDVLSELTRILPPPTWFNLLEISRAQVSFAGETDQAAPLLKTIDTSPMFKGSEFVSAPMRSQTGEVFRIKTNRTGAGPGSTKPAPEPPKTPETLNIPVPSKAPEANKK